MDKTEKIEKLVNNWLSEMDLSAFEDFYICMKTEELKDWSEEEIEQCLKIYEVQQ